MATRSLRQLLTPKTKEEHLAQSLLGARGIGIPRRQGSGTGTIKLDGAPRQAALLLVEVITGGQVGAATWRATLNNGSTWTTTIPTSTGTASVGTSGVTISFRDGPAGEGTSFVAGDKFAVALWTPGFPVAAWQPFSTPRTILEISAECSEERDEAIVRVGSGGYLETAEGEWLDLYAESMYQLQRIRGGRTVGVVLLTDSAGVGPIDFGAQELYALSDDGFRFYSTGAWYDDAGVRYGAGATLPTNGTLHLEVIAEGKGEGYNVANATVRTLETPIPGVELDNPAPAWSSTGSWVTAPGSDDEKDEDYRTRCRARWPSLSRQPPAAVFEAEARAASTEVTRVYVRPSTVTPGVVLVTVAGAGGGVSGPALAAVQAALTPIVAMCSTVVASNATPRPYTIQAMVYVEAARRAEAEAACALALNNRNRELPISGYTLVLAQIIEDLMGPAGVGNVVITVPEEDFVLLPGEVGVLTQDLDFTEV